MKIPDIPVYIRNPENTQPLKEHNQSDARASARKKNTICEIENSIVIKISNPVERYITPLLLLSWLPMLLVLLLLHNMVIYPMESHRLEVAQLKTEVQWLSERILHLEKTIASMNLPQTDEIKIKSGSEVIPEVESDQWQDQLLFTVHRMKRDTAEEMINDFKGLERPQKKIPINNAGRRGKQKQSSKKRKSALALCRHQCRRCLSYNNPKCSGFQAIHLKGAHPEIVAKVGHVGPWFIDTKAVKDTKVSSSFQLREDGESVEVESSGLYFIYAQMYYLTSHALNSFTIKLVPKASELPITLAICSSNAGSASSTSEVSCFTATMHTLQMGDRIYVQQREKNRRLIMQSGHSFLGLVKFDAN